MSKSNMAIAYNMRRRSMACGGMPQKMAEGGYAEGGEAFREEEEQSGYQPMPLPEDYEDDVVGHVMRQRYSEGGKVSNEVEDEKVEFESNEFDDLVRRDDLEQHDTGANSGDEVGDRALEEKDEDVVGQVMRSRGLRDRTPNTGQPGYGRGRRI